MKNFAPIMIAGLLMIGATTAGAQTSIGVIDSEQILSAMPEAVQADKYIAAQTQAARDTFALLDQKYKTDVQNFQQNAASMTPEAKAQEENRLKEYQQRALMWKEQKEKELQGKRAQMLSQIRDKILTAVNAVANEMKLDAVVDRKDGGMVFVSQRIDITARVKTRLGL